MGEFFRKVFAGLAFLCSYGLCLFGAYWLLAWFFPMNGALMFVINGVLAIMLLLVVFGAIITLTNRFNRHEITDMHKTVTGVLNEISKGNFNVFVEIDNHTPHREIADAVNNMVRNLGNLEAMRQDFISNVSHEIQSPLTSIGGFAKLLKEQHLPAGQRKHYAEIIEAESKRLSALSENLLKLSSLDNNKTPLAKTEFRLDKQLKAVALTLEPQWAAKNINLEVDTEDFTILADKDLLSQAWVNLLHNAIKFTPQGGDIMIGLKDATVTIADSGIGIKAEDQLHIFERFYKADKARDRSLGGNGLGLSIVKKIADLHGYSIEIESKSGQGTKVKVFLG